MKVFTDEEVQKQTEWVKSFLNPIISNPTTGAIVNPPQTNTVTLRSTGNVADPFYVDQSEFMLHQLLAIQLLQIGELKTQIQALETQLAELSEFTGKTESDRMREWANSQPKIPDLKIGDVLVAINECQMDGIDIKALELFKDYPVVNADESGFNVDSNFSDNHSFAWEDFHTFFRLKTELHKSNGGEDGN